MCVCVSTSEAHSKELWGQKCNELDFKDMIYILKSIFCTSVVWLSDFGLIKCTSRLCLEFALKLPELKQTSFTCFWKRLSLRGSYTGEGKAAVICVCNLCIFKNLTQSLISVCYYKGVCSLINFITSTVTVVTRFCGINSFLDVNFLQMQQGKCCAWFTLTRFPRRSEAYNICLYKWCLYDPPTQCAC